MGSGSFFDFEITLKTLLVVGTLFGLARLLSAIFRRFGIPAFVGEIGAGIVFVLSFNSIPLGTPAPPIPPLLGQVGILGLMFLAGTESQVVSVQRNHPRSLLGGSQDLRLILLLSILGVGVPLVLGAALLELPLTPSIAALRDEILLLWTAPLGRTSEVVWVTLCALAITSVPVISRILGDLGLLHSRLARVVLGAAILEDAFLFSVMGIVLPSLSAGLDVDPARALIPPEEVALSHILSVFLILTLALSWKKTRSTRLQPSHLAKRDAFFSALLATLALLLDLPGFLIAFASGLTFHSSALRNHAIWNKGIQVLRGVFIPLAFAAIGSKLTLHTATLSDTPFAWLTPSLILLFLLGSTLKTLTVYGVARGHRETPGFSWDLAFSMNARGGPAIVLAELSHRAGIISDRYHFELIAFAIATSWLAALWLKQSTLRQAQAHVLQVEPATVKNLDSPSLPQR